MTTTPELVKEIHKMVFDDRRLKVREQADLVDISTSAVHRILTENLDMRKLCEIGVEFADNGTKTAS